MLGGLIGWRVCADYLACLREWHWSNGPDQPDAGLRRVRRNLARLAGGNALNLWAASISARRRRWAGQERGDDGSGQRVVEAERVADVDNVLADPQ